MITARREAVLGAYARGLSPREIIAETGISKSVVYQVLRDRFGQRCADDETTRPCPRDWPADPERYRAGVA